MAKTYLLDTGLFVGVLNALDQDHARCVACLREARGRFVTVEGVLAEASHLLRKLPGATARVIEAALRMRCEVHPTTRERLTRAKQVVESHSKLRLDLVDALLCVAAEDLDITDILTLDRRDFSGVRLAGGRRFQVIP